MNSNSNNSSNQKGADMKVYKIINKETGEIRNLKFDSLAQAVEYVTRRNKEGLNLGFVNKQIQQPQEETVKKTQPPADAIKKLEKMTPDEIAEITALLERRILPNLQSDVSNYAKGRQRVWLPYEAPLGNQPFVIGLMDGEVWQWIVDRCAKHGFKAQVALISKGGNIKPHRDTTFAAPWAMGINLGQCDWHIASTRDAARTDYTMNLNGGEVFMFNSKHTHAVTNAAPDRWAINVWAIADSNAARLAGIPERLEKMLDENPEVQEFIELHQPGATVNNPKEGNKMKQDNNPVAPSHKEENMSDNSIREYIVALLDQPEIRVITNNITHYEGEWIRRGLKPLIEEVVRPTYHAGFLKKIFGSKRFIVEFTPMKNMDGELMEGYANPFKNKKKVPMDTLVFAWADLNKEVSIQCEDPKFKLQNEGVVIGNGSKAPKRFAEIVRFARGLILNDELKIKTLVLTNEDLNQVFNYLDEDEVKTTFDGCVILTPWLIRQGYGSQLRGKDFAKMMADIEKGKVTNHTFRLVTNINGKGVIVKGNGITAKSRSAMHKRLWSLGLAPQGEYFDVVTSEENVKSELGTDGSWEIMTLEPHHGTSYVRTNDQILAQYMGIKGLVDSEELLSAWRSFLAEAVQSIREGKDISWMVDIQEGRARDEQEKINAARQSTVSLLNRQIGRIHEAGLTLGVSQTLMNMRANSVRVSNLSKKKINEGLHFNFDATFDGIKLSDTFTNWSVLAKEKKANMVIPHAFRAYAMTKEMIYLAGYDIDLNKEECEYHEGTQTFAFTGSEWSRVAKILGGADLDDEIMILERLIVEMNGSFGIKAFLLRSPNDWAEFAIVDIDGPTGQARIAYEDMPTIKMKDLEKFNRIPVMGDLPSVVGHVSKPSYARPNPPVYNTACAEYMWRTAALIDLGVGGQVKVKMLQYATAGAFDTLPCPNEQMIDALQAPTGTIDDMIVLDAWEKTTLNRIVEKNPRMDAYWWFSRSVYSNKLVRQKDLNPIDPEISPIVKELMIPRQMEVIKAYKEMLDILNRQVVEIMDIQDVFESSNEEKMYVSKIKNMSDKFRRGDSRVVALETLQSILDYYNKDKEACYMFLLKSARASYLLKSRYIKDGYNPKANFDQWLYYGVEIDGITAVDLFCEALEWYRNR